MKPSFWQRKRFALGMTSLFALLLAGRLTSIEAPRTVPVMGRAQPTSGPAGLVLVSEQYPAPLTAPMTKADRHCAHPCCCHFLGEMNNNHCFMALVRASERPGRKVEYRTWANNAPDAPGAQSIVLDPVFDEY